MVNTIHFAVGSVSQEQGCQSRGRMCRKLAENMGATDRNCIQGREDTGDVAKQTKPTTAMVSEPGTMPIRRTTTV